MTSSKPSPHVAIVILNYNGAPFLRQFLPGVIKHIAGYEIMVVDNASTDESLKVMQAEFADIRVIKLAENYGFAGGYNQA